MRSRWPGGRRQPGRARRGLGWVLSCGLTLFGLVLATFAMTRLSPVDPALQMVGDHASASTYAAARLELGLDRPLPVQFLIYLRNAVSGDFGTAISTGQPVIRDILRTFPATLELATAAIMLAAGLGLALGILAALKPGSALDVLARLVSLIGYSTPIFWLGLLMLLLFYATLQWAPGPGRLDVAYAYTVDQVTGFGLVDAWLSGDRAAFANAAGHLVLPALVLAFYGMAGIARLTRAAILVELGQDYTMTARAKGASRVRVVFVHILPNIAGTLLTILALAYASLLEGAIFTETVFAWPGIGRYLTTAMFSGDMPAILGATLIVGAAIVLLNSATDLAVGRIERDRRR
ncbi:permease [Aureimonas endophytica]|uniref:Permease n=1 Tax=Aureimonas endophytica TaxID=2027858 RepID=A0A917E669_9HYPH|nr:ABC transporter permease [Aureimonas endophytica]GGE03277.1 permease [Aureimonas endophytica]